MITILKDNGETLSLTLSDAQRVSAAVRRYYCLDDLKNYFENNDIYSADVIDDDALMIALIDSYAQYRENADGGEIEDSMHWSECLSAAIADNAEMLEQYRK